MAIELRILGRHQADEHDVGFTYNGVEFRQDNLVSFLGLNSVDTREFVEQTFACLKSLGLATARMGLQAPHQSVFVPGMGKDCLPWMSELASTASAGGDGSHARGACGGSAPRLERNGKSHRRDVANRHAQHTEF